MASRTPSSPFVVLVAIGLVSFVVVRAEMPRSAGSLVQQVAVPERLIQMEHHYAQALRVHDAIIRGDLGGVQAPAKELSQATLPPGVPASASIYVGNMRAAARRAMFATTLAGAARANVDMINACASCHAALSIYPSPSIVRSPDVGGLVGHMLEHRRAADDMLQGLLISSTSSWQVGAERLRAAPLHASELPPDPRMTAAVTSAEKRVHQLADQAIQASTPAARSAVYVRLISTCAECHGLHRKVWGPGTGN